jgi:hypothetical protein
MEQQRTEPLEVKTNKGEAQMSLHKSWTLRTGLTLGAAALALVVGSNSSIAAGHESAALAGMRAGGGSAGEVRSLNERFSAMRVETLSPAGFVHATAPGASNALPFHEPRVIPPQSPTPAKQDLQSPAVKDLQSPAVKDMQQPAAKVQDPVQDPVLQRPTERTGLQSPAKQDLQSPAKQDVQSPAVKVQGPVQDPVLQRPTEKVRGPVLDPVRPSPSNAS